MLSYSGINSHLCVQTRRGLYREISSFCSIRVNDLAWTIAALIARERERKRERRNDAICRAIGNARIFARGKSPTVMPDKLSTLIPSANDTETVTVAVGTRTRTAH